MSSYELYDQDRVFDEFRQDEDGHQQDKDDYAQGIDLDGEPPEDAAPSLDVAAARAAWEACRDEPMRTGPSVRAVLEAFPAALDEVEQLRRERGVSLDRLREALIQVRDSRPSS